MKMLEQAQPKVDEDLYEWILWEQERLAILAQWQQWDELLVRVEAMPEDLPLQFKRQAATYQVRVVITKAANTVFVNVHLCVYPPHVFRGPTN